MTDLECLRRLETLNETKGEIKGKAVLNDLSGLLSVIEEVVAERFYTQPDHSYTTLRWNLYTFAFILSSLKIPYSLSRVYLQPTIGIQIELKLQRGPTNVKT